MNSDDNTPQSFSWMRRWSAALNLLITIAAVLALVAMFNYLAIRHFTRFHWNSDTEAALSVRTRQVLAALTNSVKVTVYFNSQDDLFPRIRGLLKEYEYASPRLQVQYVDWKREWTAAEKVKQEHKFLPENTKDVIIFDANGRSVVVNSRDLSDYDIGSFVRGEAEEFNRTHFKGELMFTSKIYEVSAGRATVAYYLVEHGEHAVGGNNTDGYDKFLSLLRDENNFEIRALRLGGTNEIPADCQLLIIASPISPLATVELDRIQRYLLQGGRALITFNRLTVASKRRTGLEKLLFNWGVEVGENIIRDPENSVYHTEWDLAPVNLGSHQIVNPLGRKSRLVLYMPRSIRALPAGRAEDAKVTELLFTGPKSIVITDAGRGEYDPAQTGSKPLMAVVEKTVPALQRGATRIVVLGDSKLWDNQFIDLDANHDFAAFTANWLVNQSVLLNGIPPRPIHTYKFTMTRTQLRSVQLVLLLGLPGAVLALGSLVWLRRRH